MSPQWQVLVPVKPLSRAKSRLGLSADARARLATAMCMDVVSAVIGLPDVAAVHVVSRDAAVTATARSLGARGWCVPRARGLNRELAAAAGLIRKAHAVAIVVADLPCLTPDVFVDILDHAPECASFVPDIVEQGTSMLLMPPSVRVMPRFGSGSAIAHNAMATRLRGDRTWFGARRDVDVMQDLKSAAMNGLGSFTNTWMLESADSLAEAETWGNGAELWPTHSKVAGGRVGNAVL